MFGLKSSDIDLLREVIGRYPAIDQALIYGSRAMGNYKPGSDVDIALFGNIGFETVSDLSAELNERLPLPYHFDVVAYSTLKDESLKKHIDQHGMSLYKRT